MKAQAVETLKTEWNEFRSYVNPCCQQTSQTQHETSGFRKQAEKSGRSTPRLSLEEHHHDLLSES